MIRGAIIGLGKVGWDYDANKNDDRTRSHLKALSQNPKVNVVALCDKDPKRRERLPDHLRDLPFYTDPSAMLETEKIDLLSICSPTAFHFDHWKAATDKNVPMIWLEKPAFSSLSEHLEALKTCRSTVLVNYIRRYDGLFAELATHVNEGGAVGAIVINLTYSRGFVTNGTHITDYILHLFRITDPEIKDLSVYSSRELSHATFSLGGLRFDLKGVEVPYHVLDLEIVSPSGRCGIYQNGKILRIEENSPNDQFPGFFTLKTKVEKTSDALGTNFNEILADLIDSHERSEMPKSNLETAYRSLKLTLALNEALKVP